MATLLLTTGIFASAMVAMAIGVIVSNRKLHGSCGGTGKDCVCEIEKRRECHALKHFNRAGLGAGDARAAVWQDEAVG